MLEPPPISHAALAACLRTEYGLHDLALEFLPLGADLSAAVYRASAPEAPTYFVKLKFGAFDEMSALLPRWLAEQQPVGAKGIAEVMAPLPAISGRPWAETADFRLLVYPFVDGRDGYEAMLSESQWIGFGRAMRAIHDAPLPAALARRVGREAYTSALSRRAAPRDGAVGRGTVTRRSREATGSFSERAPGGGP